MADPSNVSFTALEGGKKFSMDTIKDEKSAAYYRSLLNPEEYGQGGDDDHLTGPFSAELYGGEGQWKRREAESVNFHEPVSLAYKEHLGARRKEPRYLIWFFVLGTGLLTASVTVLMVSLLHALQKAKYYFLELGLLGFSSIDTIKTTQERDYGLGFVMWILVSVICSIIASALGKFAPQSVGGGTPEVFSLLNGIDTPSLSNLKVLGTKLLATIFSVGSGLPIGYYGPIIQAGAMISAALLARGKLWKFNFLTYFQNPRDERIILIVGSAVGVTGAFGVPLGGLMLVVEMLSTAFPLRVAFYVFVSCLSCSFIIQVFFSYFRAFQLRDRSGVSTGDLYAGAMVQFDTRILGTNIVPMNLFVFLPSILIGVIGGLFGGLYIKIGIKIVQLRKYLAEGLRLPLFRAIESSILTIIYATIVYWLTVGAFGTEVQKPSLLFSPGCNAVPNEFRVEEGTSTVNYYGIMKSVCVLPVNASIMKTAEGRPGEWFHPFGSLALGFPDSAAQMLLSWNTPRDIGVASTTVFFCLYFIFSALTTGARISGDILLPCVVMGSAVGRLVGLGTRFIAVQSASGETDEVNWADPGVFALIGAGAFLSGTTRLTFSIAVILIELTNDFRHVACVMVAISIAKAVGDKLSKSSAATYLELNEVPVLDFYEQVKRYDVFTAKDIMCTNVKSINTVETISRLCIFLKQTPHNGFPVVSAEGTVKGLILKSQISLLLWRIFLKKDHSEADYDDLRATEALLKDLNLDPRRQFPSFGLEWAEVRINLNNHIDQSTFVVSERSCLSRTYTLFQTMGVRHLVVINEDNKLSGIITRKDLLSSSMMMKILAENHRRRVAEGLEAPAAGVSNMPPGPDQNRSSEFNTRSGAFGSTAAMRGSEFTTPVSGHEENTRWTVDPNSFGHSPASGSLMVGSPGCSPRSSPNPAGARQGSPSRRVGTKGNTLAASPSVDPLVASDGRRRGMLHKNPPTPMKVSTTETTEDELQGRVKREERRETSEESDDPNSPATFGGRKSATSTTRRRDADSVTGGGGVGVPQRGGGGRKSLQKILEYRTVEESEEEGEDEERQE